MKRGILLALVAVLGLSTMGASSCETGGSDAGLTAAHHKKHHRKHKHHHKRHHAKDHSTAAAPPQTTTDSQAATQPPTDAQSNCDPNYKGACLDPNASDYDCAGGTGDGPKYVQGPVQVVGDDHFGLDRDGNGVGCQ